MSHVEPDHEDMAYTSLLREHQELVAQVEELEKRAAGELRVQTIGWDWKSQPFLDDLQEALQPFGLHVYEDPSWEGTDHMQYVISNKKLTAAELKEHTHHEDWGEE